jgi:hypothetical protein
MFASDNPNESSAVDLTPGAADWFKDAAKNARNSWDNWASGQCPKPTITVNVPKSADPVLPAALAAARRDALRAVLGTTADKFTWVVNPAGQSSKVEIDPTVNDNAAPRITVSPPSGTKVKSGRRMTIKVTATEPESGWQSGIKRIQIEDVDQHSNLQLWDNDAPMPRPCGNAGLAKTIEATAEVPERPVWHLRVTAIDYSNNRVVEKVDYPTGDWSGTIDWSIPHRNGRHWGRLDLALDYDGKGNLTGRMAGDEHQEAKWESCQQTTQTPAKLSANLVGQYTPGRNTMSLQIAEPQFEKGQLSLSGCGPGYSGAFGGGGPLHQPGLAELLNSLAVTADGGFEARGQWAVTPASAQSTLHMTLKLNRTRN